MLRYKFSAGSILQQFLKNKSELHLGVSQLSFDGIGPVLA